MSFSDTAHLNFARFNPLTSNLLLVPLFTVVQLTFYFSFTLIKQTVALVLDFFMHVSVYFIFKTLFWCDLNIYFQWVCV